MTRGRYPKVYHPHSQAEARCIDCNHRWWVSAGEVNRGDMPTCPKCASFGVATGKARMVNAKTLEASDDE
jgi:ssDNA-binding Zn-finger/Zn-ribbon topoisomerase 1